MSDILIAYGTRQGHTEKIARRIARRIRALGCHVDVVDLKRAPELDGYRAVIIGASVHARGFEREVRRWTKKHRYEIQRIPNAFFSVSLTSASHDEKSKAEIASVVATFLAQADWRPQQVANFAGALVYSQYNWLLRRVMRRIVRKESGGQYQDMSQDYDLTDYEQVDAFAHEFADQLRAAAAKRKGVRCCRAPRTLRPNMWTMLVGVDGSEPSLRALHFAADLATQLSDPEFLVVFARHAQGFMPRGVDEEISAASFDAVEDEVRANVERALASRDLRWKLISRMGEPVDVLCTVADQFDADVLIAGRREWSTARELMLGSVSNRLVHHCHRPVALVP